MTRFAFLFLLEDILGVPRGSLKESDTRDTIAGWSSIADVQILTSIASEFGIEPDAPLMEAESIGDLLCVLEGRSAFR
jgi:acyl carrier protein